ncbi:MAG: dipeptide epimerase [Chloroflexota bacterium]
MRPLDIRFRPLNLPLADPFGISSRVTAVAENVLVEIEQDGLIGYGECAPKAYYGESQASVLAWLPRLLAVVADREPADIHGAAAAMEHACAENPAARAGVEQALWDLLGKRLGIPVRNLWGIGPRCVTSSYTIGIDTPPRMAQKAHEAAEYPLLKIKVGTPNDVENLRAVREARPDARIQVDANGAWTAKAAIRSIEQLEAFNIEMVEQPVAPPDIDGLAAVAASTHLPVFADESCHGARDVPRVADACDGVVVKIQKAGGLLAALQHIHAARANGLQVMLGCMVESSLGISAAGQIAPLCDLLDLDGNLLLSSDPFDGLRASRGEVHPPLGPGLGATRTVDES